MLHDMLSWCVRTYVGLGFPWDYHFLWILLGVLTLALLWESTLVPASIDTMKKNPSIGDDHPDQTRHMELSVD